MKQVNKCPKCGLEIQASKKEKLQRKLTVNLLRSICSAVPSLESTLEGAKPYCFRCFRSEILTVVGPLAEGLLSQQKEEAAEDEQKTE